MRPDEMHVRHAQIGGKTHQGWRIEQVMTQQHHRDRRPQASIHGCTDTIDNPLEGAVASYRIVDTGRSAIQADLHANTIGRKRRERTEALALQHSTVRQDDQLPLVSSDDVLDDLDRIGTRQRFATSEVKALHAERCRLIDRVVDDRARQPVTAVWTGRHEAMLAGKVAEVVDLDPELLQAIGPQICGAPEVGHRHGAVGGNELLPQSVADERVDVKPCPCEVQSGVGGIGTNHIAKRRPAVEIVKDRQAALVAHDPVRRCGVDCHHGTGNALDDSLRRSKYQCGRLLLFACDVFVRCRRVHVTYR